MKKAALNGYLRAGLLLVGVALGISRLIQVPDGIFGLLLGLSM